MAPVFDAKRLIVDVKRQCGNWTVTVPCFRKRPRLENWDTGSVRMRSPAVGLFHSQLTYLVDGNHGHLHTRNTDSRPACQVLVNHLAEETNLPATAARRARDSCPNGHFAPIRRLHKAKEFRDSDPITLPDTILEPVLSRLSPLR